MFRRIAAIAILCAGPASAALPPQYQRAAELQAALQAALPKLGIRPVDAVEYVGADLYQVRAGHCTLEVRIVTRPDAPAIPGPRQFTAVAGEPSC